MPTVCNECGYYDEEDDCEVCLACESDDIEEIE